MKTLNKTKKLILVVTIIISALTGYSQQIPTGGYQGGKHGNIKYTLWTGSEDEDWSEPDNWCPAVVPGEKDDVVISSGAAIMPEVKSAGMTCKSLTLQPGAELVIKPGFSLTVNGKEIE